VVVSPRRGKIISTLCQANATRWAQAWTTFANVEKTWAYRQDQLPSTHPVAANMVDTDAFAIPFAGGVGDLIQSQVMKC